MDPMPSFSISHHSAVVSSNSSMNSLLSHKSRVLTLFYPLPGDGRFAKSGCETRFEQYQCLDHSMLVREMHTRPMRFYIALFTPSWIRNSPFWKILTNFCSATHFPFLSPFFNHTPQRAFCFCSSKGFAIFLVSSCDQSGSIRQYEQPFSRNFQPAMPILVLFCGLTLGEQSAEKIKQIVESANSDIFPVVHNNHIRGLIAQLIPGPYPLASET